jgi:predicted RNA-binding Zn-ribbon protein involved in translation (DUF1610 family)
MRKFGTKDACPKCGCKCTTFNSGAKVEWFGVTYNATTSTRAEDLINKEHIRTTCPVCGYYWKEYPLDSGIDK